MAEARDELLKEWTFELWLVEERENIPGRGKFMREDKNTILE